MNGAAAEHDRHHQRGHQPPQHVRINPERGELAGNTREPSVRHLRSDAAPRAIAQAARPSAAATQSVMPCWYRVSPNNRRVAGAHGETNGGAATLLGRLRDRRDHHVDSRKGEHHDGQPEDDGQLGPAGPRRSRPATATPTAMPSAGCCRQPGSVRAGSARTIEPMRRGAPGRSCHRCVRTTPARIADARELGLHRQHDIEVLPEEPCVARQHADHAIAFVTATEIFRPRQPNRSPDDVGGAAVAALPELVRQQNDAIAARTIGVERGSPPKADANAERAKKSGDTTVAESGSGGSPGSESALKSAAV